MTGPLHDINNSWWAPMGQNNGSQIRQFHCAMLLINSPWAHTGQMTKSIYIYIYILICIWHTWLSQCALWLFFWFNIHHKTLQVIDQFTEVFFLVLETTHQFVSNGNWILGGAHGHTCWGVFRSADWAWRIWIVGIASDWLVGGTDCSFWPHELVECRS